MLNLLLPHPNAQSSRYDGRSDALELFIPFPERYTEGGFDEALQRY
jgi:hypothetical protein